VVLVAQRNDGTRSVAEYRNVGVDQFDGDKLKAWRIRRGMSQNDLAVASGCSGAVTIWRYESGRRLPNADTTRKLANALGIETGQLMRRDK